METVGRVKTQFNTIWGSNSNKVPLSVTKPGALVISLDFEQAWGICRFLKFEQSRKAVMGGREAVLQMLDLFARDNVRATWAIVGAMFCETKQELLDSLPETSPLHLLNLGLVGEDEKTDPLHFGLSQILRIRATPGQEIATHTHTHYGCFDSSATPERFGDDLDAAIKIMRHKIGITPRSIAFPGNQYSAAYLEAAAEKGITSYRGNETSPLFSWSKNSYKLLAKRGLRLADAFINISGHHTYQPEPATQGLPVNVRSSKFLRPAEEVDAFPRRVRMERICSAMQQAARNGEIFHLWWHPHNFGNDVEANMNMLKELVAQYRILQSEYGMRSMTMQDAALLSSATRATPFMQAAE